MILNTTQVLVDLASAPDHGHLVLATAADPGGGLEPAAVFVRFLVLAAGAAAAGTALWRPAARAVLFGRGCAVVAAVASLMAIELGDVPVVLAVGCAAALAVLVARPATPVAGWLAAGLLAVLAGSGYDGAAQYVAAATFLAATALLGATTLLATAPPNTDVGRSTRDRVDPVRVDRPTSNRRVAWLAAWVGGAVALTGTAAVVLPAPAAPPAPGVPLLTSLAGRDRAVPVLVVPHRPGWNLVAIGASSGAAGLDRTRLTSAGPRPGTGHSWAVVHLPAGPGRLWISAAGARTAAVPVDPGTAEGAVDLRGPDGPECASTVLGALLAGVAKPVLACPADRLSADDAAALRATVRFLAGRGHRAVTLVADGSPRGTAAVAEVRSAAREHDVTVNDRGSIRDPLVIVSGWDTADTVLRDVVAGRIAAQGAYLAPWLLTGPLLAHPVGQLVPLRFAPTDPLPQQYLAALSARFPGAPATGGGYAAWLAARGHAPPGAPLLIYASATLSLPGGGGGGGHHAASTRWLPGGTIVAVSGRLDDR